MKDFITLTAVATLISFAMFGMFTVGGSVGMRAGRHAAQREAVEAGAGKWTVDQHTGEKGFEWTPAKGGTP